MSGFVAAALLADARDGNGCSQGAAAAACERIRGRGNRRCAEIKAGASVVNQKYDVESVQACAGMGCTERVDTAALYALRSKSDCALRATCIAISRDI